MEATGYDPKLEVNGAYLLGIINSINEENIKPFREHHQLMEIDPNQWYPASQVVAFYNDIANAPGGMFDLVAIGINVTMKVEYPPQVKTLQDAISIAPQMHYAAWRGGSPGELDVQMVSDRHVHFAFHDLPLPADLVYGLCFGMVKRFLPPGTHFRVVQNIEENSYIYDLSW
jgi:hypothetical protein